MEEEESFLRDFFEATKKVIELGGYMKSLVEFAMGRYTAKKQQAQDEVIVKEKHQPTKLNKIAICSNLSKEEEESMKNIRHRNDGRWEFRMQINNKRHSIIGKTRTELLNKVKAFKKATKAESAILSPTRGNQKVSEFANYWFDTFKSASVEEKTRKMYKDTIKNIEKFKVNIQDVNSIKLQEFLNTFPPTRTKELIYMVLKQVFKKAYELKMTREDVSQFLVKGKIQRTTRDIINIDDQKKLVEHLQGKTDDFSMALYVYLLTGCRPLEINRICKKHIGENRIFIDGTKRTRSKRFVRISSSFSSMLKDFSKNLKADDHLFDFTYDALQDRFDSLKEELNIKGSIYCMRHTYSTNIYYLGATDKERQESMGHASSTLTNDVYTHIDFNMNKKNLKKIYGALYPNYTHR